MTIKLKINDKDVELTPAEAKALYKQLREVFAEEVVIREPYPVYTPPVYIPVLAPTQTPYFPYNPGPFGVDPLHPGITICGDIHNGMGGGYGSPNRTGTAYWHEGEPCARN